MHLASSEQEGDSVSGGMRRMELLPAHHLADKVHLDLGQLLRRNPTARLEHVGFGQAL